MSKLLIIVGGIIGGTFVLFILTLDCNFNLIPNFANCDKILIDLGHTGLRLFSFSFLICIGVFAFLVIYRRNLYLDETTFGVLHKRGQKEARKCTICGRHPLYKKYHLNTEHRLKKVKVNDHFVDCGCGLCYSLRRFSGIFE